MPRPGRRHSAPDILCRRITRLESVDSDIVALIAPTIHREPSGESWLEAGRARVRCTVTCAIDGTHGDGAVKRLLVCRREAASYIAQYIAGDRIVQRLDPRDVGVGLLVHPASVTATVTAWCNRRGSEPCALLRDATEDAIDLMSRLPGAEATEANREVVDTRLGANADLRTTGSAHGSATTSARRCFRASRGCKWLLALSRCVRHCPVPMGKRELPAIGLAWTHG